MRSILNSNDAVEAYVEAYTTLCVVAGMDSLQLAEMIDTYRKALYLLVDLGRSEYTTGVSNDILQAMRALRKD